VTAEGRAHAEKKRSIREIKEEGSDRRPSRRLSRDYNFEEKTKVTIAEGAEGLLKSAPERRPEEFKMEKGGVLGERHFFWFPGGGAISNRLA